MIVGVDVDGVIADVMTPWLERCNQRLYEQGKAADWQHDDITQWGFWGQIGLTEQEVWDQFPATIYDDVLPYPGQKAAVDAIRAQGHTIHYVTSCQTLDHAAAKLEWLRQYGFWTYGVDDFTATGSKFYHKDKTTVPVDWLIDDNVDNCVTFPKYSLLVTRPHNRNDITNVKRVKGLEDAVVLLKYASVAEGSHPAQADGDLGDKTPADEWTGSDEVFKHDGAGVRKFETGATRDVDTNKYDYEAFLSPLVLERYAAYMHKNRFQKDGTMRDGDNWQKGIPTTAYMKSGWRHFFAWWRSHRITLGINVPNDAFWDRMEEELCALLFNVMGYLHELRKARQSGTAKQSAA